MSLQKIFSHIPRIQMYHVHSDMYFSFNGDSAILVADMTYQHFAVFACRSINQMFQVFNAYVNFKVLLPHLCWYIKSSITDCSLRIKIYILKEIFIATFVWDCLATMKTKEGFWKFNSCVNSIALEIVMTSIPNTLHLKSFCHRYSSESPKQTCTKILYVFHCS